IFSMSIRQKLAKKLANRQELGLLRKLFLDYERIDFLSNDYLGLARSTALKKRIQEDYQQLPHVTNGARGSRLLSGNTAYAEALERSEEHTSELQSRDNLVCRLLLEKKKSTPRR